MSLLGGDKLGLYPNTQRKSQQKLLLRFETVQTKSSIFLSFTWTHGFAVFSGMEISEYSVLHFLDLLRIRKHRDFSGSPAINISNLIGSLDLLGFGGQSKPNQKTF